MYGPCGGDVYVYSFLLRIRFWNSWLSISVAMPMKSRHNWRPREKQTLGSKKKSEEEKSDKEEEGACVMQYLLIVLTAGIYRDVFTQTLDIFISRSKLFSEHRYYSL